MGSSWIKQAYVSLESCSVYEALAVPLYQPTPCFSAKPMFCEAYDGCYTNQDVSFARPYTGQWNYECATRSVFRSGSEDPNPVGLGKLVSSHPLDLGARECRASGV